MKARLGTRASGLARAQSGAVVDLVKERAAARGLEFAVSIIPVTAEADTLHGSAEEPHAAFVGALRVALLAGECDLVVHPLHDILFSPHPDLRIAAVLRRWEPQDSLLTGGPVLADLPPSPRIALDGVRRSAQILALRPDVISVEAYGSVRSRIERLMGGDIEGLVVPRAHLAVLGLGHPAIYDFPLEDMLPGPAEGFLAVEVRADAPDDFTALIEALDDPGSRAASRAECAAVEALDPDGNLAVCAYATVEGATLRLHVRVLSARGALVLNDFSSGLTAEAELLGSHAALALVGRGARRLLGAVV